MLHLPHKTDFDNQHKNITAEKLASQLYPNLIFDTSLPQQWVDLVTDRGFDPLGSVVWGYPGTNFCGQPFPLTAEAALALARLTINLR